MYDKYFLLEFSILNGYIPVVVVNQHFQCMAHFFN